MKFALLSDIHSNKIALDAVLSDLENENIDRVLCAGDVVGYNPWPSECVETIQEVAYKTVRGNHDREVTNPEKYKGSNRMAYKGLKHSKEELTKSQINWVRNNPPKTEFANGKGLLVHSHPENRDKYVFPKDFARMRPYMDEYKYMVLGHTHVQHLAKIDGRIIVNPGSVGQPRDKDFKAAYVVLNTKTDEVSMRRSEYNVDDVISEVEKCPLPIETGTRLLNGE